MGVCLKQQFFSDFKFFNSTEEDCSRLAENKPNKAGVIFILAHACEHKKKQIYQKIFEFIHSTI